MELSSYRFRLCTKDSIGAYTVVKSSDQATALADLLKQLMPWEHALPLHGPSRSIRYWC